MNMPLLPRRKMFRRAPPFPADGALSSSLTSSIVRIYRHFASASSKLHQKIKKPREKFPKSGEITVAFRPVFCYNGVCMNGQTFCPFVHPKREGPAGNRMPRRNTGGARLSRTGRKGALR
jgi:hypothetical protein